MQKNTARIKPIQTFFSCEKDTLAILKKLFVEARPYSDYLKRLLVVNTKDCLDPDNIEYTAAIQNMSISKLKEENYIKIVPRLQMGEHEEAKSYIMISFDNFRPCATNPQFTDCIVTFDIFCPLEYWDLGDFQLRPLKIAGYINGILNGCRLSGIGTFQFAGCDELLLDSSLCGYTLSFAATHGSDDTLPGKED